MTRRDAPVLPPDFATRKPWARTLIERRVAAGLTQDELAKAVRTHRTHIVSVETGRYRPRKLAPALAEVLGGQPSDYLPEMPSRSIQEEVEDLQAEVAELRAQVDEALRLIEYQLGQRRSGRARS